jgi:hypothetical protein
MGGTFTRFLARRGPLLLVVAVAAGPATQPADWGAADAGTPSDLIDGWTKGGRAPPDEGSIVIRDGRKWLRLDPLAAQGGASILEVARKAPVDAAGGVEAVVEILFVDPRPVAPAGDVLVMLRSADGKQRYQLNVGPGQLMLGMLRGEKFHPQPGVAVPVAAPGTPVRVRLRLDVRGGDHVLSAYVADAVEPAVTATFAAAAPDAGPLDLAGGVRLALGVQNGFAAEFTGADLRPLTP